MSPPSNGSAPATSHQPPATDLLHLHQVTKIFPMGDSEVRALNGIDLDIASGEYVGVVGPSGSGKTTLMDIIGCLSRPTAGSYEFEGRRVHEVDDAGLAI